MNVKFLKKENFGYKFLLQSTRYDVLNAIKRTVTRRIKSYAIDKVIVYKNESVMPDEFLAHRLGLVPIYTKDVEDDAKISLYLKKTGGIVKSGDIETNGDVEIPLKNIPLVKLNEGKSIELELVVKAGTGKEHVKWSPALVYYKNLPDLKQKGNVDKSIVDVCPKNILEIKANKVVLKDPYKCDICKLCEVKSNGALQLDLKDDEYVLTIEPYGNLDVKTIIKETTEFINNELTELENQIKKIK